MAFCKSLADNLIKNGLQPFIFRSSNKKGQYNNKYFKNEKLTLGNTREILDYMEFFNITDDSNVGIFLKNTKIRDANKGFFFLDFDLKGNDDMSVFDDIVKDLKIYGYWEQVEKKRNGKGYHLCLKTSLKDMELLEAQGKIYRGESSFVEVLTAGKFLRLCPNQDYIIDDTEGKHIIFENVKTIKIDELLSLSKNNNADKILKRSSTKKTKHIVKADIDFSKIKNSTEFVQPEKTLVCNYILSKKMEYDEALQMTCGLGALQWFDVFKSSIPNEKIGEYIGLFEKSIKEKPYKTNYMKSLLNALEDSKYKKIITGNYLDVEQVKEIFNSDNKKHLVVSPTGTGKTHAFLNAAKELKEKIIFTVPNVAVAHQFGSKYDFIKVSHSNISFEKAIHSGDIIVCTIDKLANCPEHIDLENHIIINDEKHSHVTSADFRTKAVHFSNKVSKRAKKIIDITATPEPLYMGDYDKKTLFCKKDEKKYDVNVYSTKKVTKTVLKLLKETEGQKRIVLNNNIAFNETYASTNQNYISLDSTKKKSDVYNYLVNNNKIPESVETVLTTDLFSAGLNINNDGEWHVIIAGFKDPATIRQFVARFRNVKNIKVSIIISRNDVKEIDLESYTDFLFLVNEKRMKELNKNTMTAVVKEKGILQDDCFILSEDSGNYEMVHDKILNDSWKYFVKHISPYDLMMCFDDDSYTLNVEYLDEEEYENEILENIKETREQRKNIKVSKKYKTIEALEVYQDLCYIFKDDKDYDNEILDKYLKLSNEYKLPHSVVMKFCENKDFDYEVRFRTMAYFLQKKGSDEILRKNKIYKITKYVYNIRKGSILNITDLANDKKFKRLDLKRCFDSLWEYEEIRDKNKRNIKLLSRKNKKLFSMKEFKILLSTGYILDKKTANILQLQF
jgi:hypothetical protein